MVRAFDAGTGARLWSSAFNNGSDTSIPVAADGVVYTLAYRKMPGYKMVEFVCENNREYVDEQGKVRMRLRGR